MPGVRERDKEMREERKGKVWGDREEEKRTLLVCNHGNIQQSQQGRPRQDAAVVSQSWSGSAPGKDLLRVRFQTGTDYQIR